MKSASDLSLSIHDLIEQTGVPRRTIYFYTQQGLIPAPEGAGPGARYNQVHLLRLRAIPRLRLQGLRLDQIRTRLAQMTPADIQELLNNTSAPAHTSAAPLPTESYSHFSLPGGITITAPEKLAPDHRRKLEKLLEQAQTIFQDHFSHTRQEE